MSLDPWVFSPAAVSPATKAWNARIREAMSQDPPARERTPAELRAAAEEGRGWRGKPVRLDIAQPRTIKGPAGEIPLRVFVPETVAGVYLYIHGGGWAIGAADLQDERLWETARAASLAVVSVEYRLAPEQPYPAGPDDCEAAAAWLAEHAKREFGTGRLAIGGHSAGAHLSVATLLRMRDRHGYTGFSAANLVYGMYDLGCTPSARAGEDKLVIPTSAIEWFLDLFVPAERRRDPDVSPLYADLREMPPALFTVGTEDPLLDDSLFMHQRWLAAGNPGALAVYPGGVHGFDGMPLELGRQATARQHEFLRAAVSG